MWAALIFVAVMAAILLYSESSQAAVPLPAGQEGDCQVACCNITFDPATWPSGDRVWNVCRAIAHAEGADVEGSNPDRLNNPGDISDGALTYGFEFHSGSSLTTFP